MKNCFCGDYGRQKLTFYPAPFKSPIRAFIVLLFAWIDGKVVICDIQGRGWCVPSGRVEPGEDSLTAVRREAKEEAGIELADLQYIGCYRIEDRGEVRWGDCFAARICKFTDIGIPEESKGRKAVLIEELPELYHYWNAMTENVFQHSHCVVKRLESVKGPCEAPEGEL